MFFGFIVVVVFVFHQKICVFIIFISFFDELSNFGNRIFANLTEIGDKELSMELYVYEFPNEMPKNLRLRI